MKRPAKGSPAESAASARRAKGRGSSSKHQAPDSKQTVSAPGGESEEAPPKPPRPPSAETCQPFVRRQLAKALPDVCIALAEKAKKGDVSAMKLLWQMAELDKKSEAVPEQADVTRFVRETLAEHRRR